LTAPGDGGGIYTVGHLAVTDTTFTENSAHAVGGADSNADLTIVGSTLMNNVGPAGAGGAAATRSMLVENSTVAGNTALQVGAGGIGAYGPITVINSTITGNEAGNVGGLGGGGIFSDSAVTLVYATVVDNGATGTVANVVAGGGLHSFASVIALPRRGAANCQAPGTSAGYNFSDDSSCGFTSTGDRQNGDDPQLGALADNGGPTLTRAPAGTSPLVDAIPVGSCQADGAAGITTDQRGTKRPQRVGCDIGAVELVAAATAPTTPTPVVLTPQFTG
jgi:hypothetical protein